MPLQIHPARFPEDSAKIAEIAGAVWKGSANAIIEKHYGRIGSAPWQHWLSQDILAWLQAPNAQAFVVHDHDEIIGFCSLQIDRERDTATVGYNGVAPAHQGRGIGSLMMDYIMERIRESGVGHAAVLVADNDEHAPARRIYEKAGFRPVYSLNYMFQKLR